MKMSLSNNGLNLIKQFEGCRLTAYKAVKTEQYWTIGWGHYGPDVKEGQKITQAEADNLFKKDLKIYENYVNQLELALNQNQFDALVSFCYNCGVGNLRKLVKNRSLLQIGETMLLYNKSGGVVLAGLVRRRKAEYELFNTPIGQLQLVKKYRVTAYALNVRAGIGTKYKILRVLQQNQIVNVERTSNGWGYIGDGWISLKYAKQL